MKKLIFKPIYENLAPYSDLEGMVFRNLENTEVNENAIFITFLSACFEAITNSFRPMMGAYIIMKFVKGIGFRKRNIRLYSTLNREQGIRNKEPVPYFSFE